MMNLSKQRQSKKKALILTGLTILALPLVLPFQKATAAFTFTKVADFTGANGAEPRAGVVAGKSPDTNLYGTTSQGGSSANNGTVFKFSPLTTLLNFAGTSSPKGSNPVARLFLASDGNFYGVTLKGGANNLGSLFKLLPPSFTTLTTLFDFTGTSGSNLGSAPAGRLISGSDGNLWGTTSSGGANNFGTIFKVSPTSAPFTPTIVATFNGTNGSTPLARLQLGSDGKYYGTASQGGSSNRGVVYKLDPTTTPPTLTVVSFNGTNGANPQSGLIESGGFLYGTTKLGGASNNGVVFKIALGFTSTAISYASFDGTNGSEPEAALTPGANGIFYGTASGGGTNGTGTIYQFDPGTGITRLYSFNALGSSNVSGAKPESTLIPVVISSVTNYYGTASGGGANGLGTVFKFTP